jgi:lipoyl(octanoyl) transferase
MPPMSSETPIRRMLGTVAYTPTWQAMREFTDRRNAQTPDELWLLQHDPVYTLGVAGRLQHLLDAGAIPVVKTDRGGQITYHGPGQAIVYALLDLRRLGVTVRELVYRIEQSVIQVLEPMGLGARRVPGAPGVYVPYGGVLREGPFAGLAKIAALGIRIRNGCSYHGVALNVAMDLGPFRGIDPCGFAGLPAVDLATLGLEFTCDDVARRLSDRLTAHVQP